MPEDWEREPWERRKVIKLALAVGAAGAATAAGVAFGVPLLQRHLPRRVLQDKLIYTRFPTAPWWNPLAGEPMRVTDFQEWQGATGIWLGFFPTAGSCRGPGYPFSRFA